MHSRVHKENASGKAFTCMWNVICSELDPCFLEFKNKIMNVDQNKCKITGMEIVWQDREHEDMNRESMHDPLNLNALH